MGVTLTQICSLFMTLNDRTAKLVQSLLANADTLHVKPNNIGGATVIDCGITASGGLEAGRRMAEVCLAGLGDVSITPGDKSLYDGPFVTVRTDSPVAACMASQYAGWEVKGEKFFAMASGPMRAAAGREALFDDIDHRETATQCIGVLESSELPPADVCQEIAEKCGIAPSELTLLVAPTNSQAGNLQVVARSVETALHKLHELGFDLTRIDSGWGTAPLPPVAKDALGGIGRTNDSILYGTHTLLYVHGDDESINSIGNQVPSSASSDHGKPFKQIFAAYDYDFYKIDKHLFSPAVVTFVNLETGKTSSFGSYAPEVLKASFES